MLSVRHRKRPVAWNGLIKDPIENKNFSGRIIYRYTCSNCKESTYYGKTFHHFYTRAAEHMGISNLTERRLKTLNSLQYLTIYYTISFDDFSVLATDYRKFKLPLRKSLLIKHEKPFLSRTMKLFPLELFDYDDSFISNITWLSDFILICNSNFILCTDRVRTSIKYYVKGKRECSFGKALAEMTESSTNLKYMAWSKDCFTQPLCSINNVLRNIAGKPLCRCFPENFEKF